MDRPAAPRRPPHPPQGQGHRPRQDRLHRAFLSDVSARHASLREVTTQEIAGWLAGRRAALDEACAIRSLFKALAARRLIFTDPARALRAGQRIASEPLPLPGHLTRKIGTAADTDPLLRMVIALIAIHGMYPKQARELPLEALDLRQGRLTHGQLSRPLDTYTRKAAAAYLSRLPPPALARHHKPLPARIQPDRAHRPARHQRLAAQPLPPPARHHAAAPPGQAPGRSSPLPRRPDAPRRHVRHQPPGQPPLHQGRHRPPRARPVNPRVNQPSRTATTLGLAANTTQ